MSDIVERLRSLADLFEAGDAPRHVVMHMRAGADEIERLRSRLEVDPSHPYDGIYCRDETIRGLEKEIERLRAGGCARDQGTTQYCAEATKKDAEISSLLNTLADERTESMKLRAALERIASLDVPRPIGHTFRADGVASKHDKCWHGETMYDECAACLSNYARAALEGK